MLTVTARGLRGMKMALGHRGLLYVVAFTTVLVLAGGAAISLMNRTTFRAVSGPASGGVSSPLPP